MTFTLAWLVLAFILGAFSMLATVIVLSALWVGRDSAPALPCGGDGDDGDDANLRARIAELEAALAEAQAWVPPATYGTGTLAIGDRLYVEIPDWGGAEEDAVWSHLNDAELGQ